MAGETKIDKARLFVKEKEGLNFTTKELSIHLQSPMTYAGTVLSGLTKEGLCDRVTAGHYIGILALEKKEKPVPDGIGGAQIGKAILDYVDDLKAKLFRERAENRETQTALKSKVSQKEETIKKLNEMLRDAKSAGTQDTRTIKLGDIAKIRK